MKVKLVVIKLRGYAFLWWENLKRDYEREGRAQICTWERMKRELCQQFFQEIYEQEVYLKFYGFRQGDLSVEEYTREFEFLKLKCDAKEKTPQTIAR